jgi:hypothetical protein
MALFSFGTHNAAGLFGPSWCAIPSWGKRPLHFAAAYAQSPGHSSGVAGIWCGSEFELDWEGTSPLKDALDAALRRLHWHMGKRERELQKFADICSRLVRSGASGRATVIELPYRVSGPSGRDLENISSRSSREKEKISSVPGHLVSLILHIFRKEKQNLPLILLVLVLVLVLLFLLLLLIIIIILIIRFLLFLLLLLLITSRLIAIAP